MSDLDIDFRIIDGHGFDHRFTSLKALLNFCVNEADYWESASAQIATVTKERTPFIGVHGSFRQISNEITKFLEELPNYDMNNFPNWQTHLIRNHINPIQSRWIWSGHPFTKEYIGIIQKQGSKAAEAFINFLVNKNLNGQNDYDTFIGVMAGYNFLTDMGSESERVLSEKNSLDDIRELYLKNQNEIFNDHNKKSTQYEDWEDSVRNKADSLDRAARKLFRAKMAKQKAVNDALLADQKSALDSLHETYHKLLQLKAPAKYWDDLSIKLLLQGFLWLGCLAILIIWGLNVLQDFYMSWSEGKKIALELNTVQGVAIFATFIAIFGFFVRVLSRLAFSSFHLMRDAQERRQLTYLYLALVNEAAVDDKTREIVIQALFSRSETGLLNNESGPTLAQVSNLQARNPNP